MTNDNFYTDFVSFPLDDGSYENLHARCVGRNIYILDNSPFYFYGVSAGDEIVCSIDDGRNLFDYVKRHSGHSTYRIKMERQKSHEDFLEAFEKLCALGCSFEGTGVGGRRLYAVDLDPRVDVYAVYRLLEEGEEKGLWEFEEAHFFNEGDKERGSQKEHN